MMPPEAPTGRMYVLFDTTTTTIITIITTIATIASSNST
jgi:hypothetical protein